METVQQLIVCGGCNAKIGPGNLGELLADLPKATNENLLVGFDSTDDAAVIKLRDDLAIIQTLDFSRRWLLIRIFSVRSRPQMH